MTSPVVVVYTGRGATPIELAADAGDYKLLFAAPAGDLPSCWQRLASSLTSPTRRPAPPRSRPGTAGQYTLLYRVGGVSQPSRSANGLIGTVRLPLATGAWKRLTLKPVDDIAAL
jgi:hypothetical protein